MSRNGCKLLILLTIQEHRGSACIAMALCNLLNLIGFLYLNFYCETFAKQPQLTCTLPRHAVRFVKLLV